MENENPPYLTMIVIAATAAALAYGARAQAAPFIEAGQTAYNHPVCILWHQECAGYETHWNMRPAMVRVGIESDGWRISYANLGTYSHAAEATDLEDCAISRRDQSCGGDTDWYFVTGSQQAVIASYRAEWWQRRVYTEVGAGIFHQSFSLVKDDGHTANHSAFGPGAMVGVGLQFKRVSVGASLYHTGIGQSFDGGKTPAGVRNASVVSVTYLF